MNQSDDGNSTSSSGTTVDQTADSNPLIDIPAVHTKIQSPSQEMEGKELWYRYDIVDPLPRPRSSLDQEQARFPDVQADEEDYVSVLPFFGHSTN